MQHAQPPPTSTADVGNKVIRLTPGQIVRLEDAGLQIDVKLLSVEPGTDRARVLFIAPKRVAIEPPNERTHRHDVATRRQRPRRRHSA